MGWEQLRSPTAEVVLLKLIENVPSCYTCNQWSDSRVSDRPKMRFVIEGNHTTMWIRMVGSFQAIDSLSRRLGLSSRDQEGKNLRRTRTCGGCKFWRTTKYDYYAPGPLKRIYPLRCSIMPVCRTWTVTGMAPNSDGPIEIKYNEQTGGGRTQIPVNQARWDKEESKRYGGSTALF